MYLGTRLLGIDTNMRKSITPAEKLAVTLRYLGTGCTFIDLHYTFKLGASTVENIVREVCIAVWEELAHIEMPSLTEQLWKNTAEMFEQRANFPHCLGARLLMQIINFCTSMSDLFGRTPDSTIFKKFTLWNLLTRNELNIPKACPITNTNIVANYVFVGDEAFGLSEHVLRPYGGRNLTNKKRIFNYRLSRARRYVECAFGILSNKWRIFHRPLNVNTELAVNITNACCVLHNFVRERNGIDFKDSLTVEGFEEINPKEQFHGNMISRTKCKTMI
ncbi:protein ALP1-like [Acyrthosiphon pisum]|uniref:DDE Tnp4 domain-containing protein n=1 Tax=Acyrthosiphon pisum TaxID=7029 RepID=A0A8R2JVT0_ACYPI|nr:protein ALP1-like [Acyrthosiphon pisum]